MGEGEDEEECDLQDERMVLTPQDQEILLEQLVGGEKGHEDEIERPFEEEVSEKLEEISKQQQLDQSFKLSFPNKLFNFSKRINGRSSKVKINSKKMKNRIWMFTESLWK